MKNTCSRNESPSPRKQAEAFKYTSEWCRSAYEFVSRKTPKWKLLEDLYHNRRELSSWDAPRSASMLDGNSDSPSNRWQSDIVLAPSYIVDSWSDRAYQAIFNGPEWLTVVSETTSFGPVSGGFPTSFKLQELLLAKLRSGGIHVRIYEALQHLALYGSAFAKTAWHSSTPIEQCHDCIDQEATGRAKHSYPVIQIIPPDRMLLDWTANHNDIQRHSGIGHRVEKSLTHVLEQFHRGIYHLNKSKVLERWGESKSTNNDQFQLGADKDTDGIPDPGTVRVTVWEWHGKIPDNDTYRESIVVIITDRNSTNPQDGIMVRLVEDPILWNGLRPFVSAHYTPLPGPLGIGAVESNLDLIHSISQFISQSQDNARLTANAQLMVRRGSSASRQLQDDDNTIYPGKVWLFDEPGDVQPFPPLNFPQQDVNYLINYLNTLLERRTTVSDFSLGIPGLGKTATEAHILQEASMTPFTTRTDLFARCFLEPLGTMALSMMQKFSTGNEVITIRDYSGMDRSVPIEEHEIRYGRFRVSATLTRQDSTRIAKAQSIERVLPTLAKFQPLLRREGVTVSFSELIKRYLDLVGVDGSERVLNRIDHMPSDSVDLNYGSEPEDVPPRLVEQGGPMGPQPTDENAMSQLFGMLAR